jgi:hypothetical protein
MLDRLFARYRLLAREARFIRVSLLLAAGLNLLTWALTLWFALPRLATSPFFALHYTVYFGVDQIGAPWHLLFLPLLGLLILVVNALLAVRLYSGERFVSAFLSALTLLLEALLLLVSFLTVLLNI